MAKTSNIRKERVERLLMELEYEITRGMLDGDLEERMGFRFYVPISRAIANGVVLCEFRTKPVQRWEMDHRGARPRLSLVSPASEGKTDG